MGIHQVVHVIRVEIDRSYVHRTLCTKYALIFVLLSFQVVAKATSSGKPSLPIYSHDRMMVRTARTFNVPSSVVIMISGSAVISSFLPFYLTYKATGIARFVTLLRFLLVSTPQHVLAHAKLKPNAYGRSRQNSFDSFVPIHMPYDSLVQPIR